jgi:hypothetical protein
VSYSTFADLDTVDEILNALAYQISLNSTAELLALQAAFEAEQAAIIAALPNVASGGFIDGTLTAGEIPFATGAHSVASSSNITWDDIANIFQVTGRTILDGNVTFTGGGIDITNVPLSMFSGVGSDYNRLAFYLNNITQEAQFALGDVGATHQWTWGSQSGAAFSADYGLHFQYDGTEIASFNNDGSTTIAGMLTVGNGLTVSPDSGDPSTFWGQLNVNATLDVSGVTQTQGMVNLAGFEITQQSGAAPLISTSDAAGWTDHSGADIGSLTNAPTAGNPSKWLAVNDNGTTRYIPAW